MLLIFLFRSGEIKGGQLFQEKQVKYFTFLFLIMVVGIPFSLYTGLSFRVIFTDYIKVVAFVYLFYKIVDSKDRLLTLLLVGCLGNGLYSAYSVAAGKLGGGRLYFGGMFDPNDLAYFALAFLPLNLLFISRDNPLWMRLACIGSFGCGTLLILMTGSRGGAVAFGVAALLLLLFKTRTVSRSLKTSFVLMCFLMVSFGAINTERYMTIFSLEEDYNLTAETGRKAIWKIGIRAMLANPLTGVGVQCFSNAVGLDREARGAETIRWQSAHSSVIQIGTETGVIGLVLYLVMSLNVVRIFIKAKRGAISERLGKVGEMGLVGFAGLFISGLFLSQAYSLYWAFYIVLSAVMNRLLAREQALVPRPG